MTDVSVQRWQEADRILDEALDVPVDGRDAFLLRRCDGDEGLLAEVKSLLEAVDRSRTFLERGALEAERDPGSPDTERDAMAVGAWRLIRRIGRGGMGEVFEGERADGAFAQRVAVKMIRSDVAVSTARFLVERQIIATLVHPNIVRLIDGGVAPDGRPYAVMDYVEGQALRDYCAARQPDLAARIALFRQIASAVAFAHRHLVVHRDLKPANVLVDAEGRVKLLDFGIAKLMSREVDDAHQTQTLLTPDSAAPELLTGGAVTTATDVYGLGLILHELITGQPPYRLGAKPLAVMINQILNRELLPPCSRAIVPIPRGMRADLDAIVMKALRHDPQQRYGAASAMLQDLDRWATGFPVEARGGAARYVAERFLRRHRLAVSAGALMLLLLIGGIAGIAWQAREAALQRDDARAQATRLQSVHDYLLHMFRVADEEKAMGETVTARTVLDKTAARLRREFANDPAAARSMLLSLGELYFQIGDLPGAEVLLRQFLELADENTEGDALATVKQRLAEITFQPGDPLPAQRLLAEAQAIWSRQPELYAESLQNSRILEAAFERETGNPARGAQILDQLAAQAQEAGGDPEYVAVILNELASAHSELGDFARAIAIYRQALDRFSTLGKQETSNAAITLNNLCGAMHLAGDTTEAERCALRALELRKTLFGSSANSAAVKLLLGRIRLARNDPAGALTVLEEGHASSLRYAGPAAVLTLRTQLAMAHALTELGRPDEARALLDQLATSSPGPWFAGLVLMERARLARRGGREAEAAALLAEAEPLIRLPHLNLQDDLATLAPLLAASGR